MLPKTKELSTEQGSKPETKIEKVEDNFSKLETAGSKIRTEKSPLHDRSLSTKSEESHAEEENIWKNRKRVSFVTKTTKRIKNPSELKKDSSDIKKTTPAIHPNILIAKRIAERVKWSKKKDVNIQPQSSGKTVPNALGEKTLLSSDAKCNMPVKPKEVIAPVNTEKDVKAKRKKKDARKKKDDDLIRSIIKEISGSPTRDEGSKLPVKNRKAGCYDKNDEYDAYNRFLKSKEESGDAKESKLSVKDNERNFTESKEKKHDVYKQFLMSKEESPPVKPLVKMKRHSKQIRVTPCDEPVPEQVLINLSDLVGEYDEVTDMEVEEQEIITKIANFRGSVSHSRNAGSNQFLTSTINRNSNSVYFVVDTNVLIQDIGFLEGLKMKEIDEKEIIIVIPYTALQEMDGLKKNESIGKACQTAICWCNTHFEKNDPRVQGQSYDNFLKTVAESKGSSGDDLIRDCCLFLKKEGLDVCLLTNDVNLRNKALMAAIDAFSVRSLKMNLVKEYRKTADQHISNDLLEDEDSQMCGAARPRFDLVTEDNFNKSVSEYPQLEKMICDITPKQSKKSISAKQQGSSKLFRKNIKSRVPSLSEEEKLLKGIHNSLHHTLGHILEIIMKDTYEDIWLKIIKHKPPWSINEVFSCWEKHWIAVMSDRFPRELKKLLTEIRYDLGECKRGSGDAVALCEKVQILYRFFKSKPYLDYILPIDGQPLETVMSEIPKESSVSPSSDEVRDSDKEKRLTDDSETSVTEQVVSSGMTNIEQMINLVGIRITHFIPSFCMPFCSFYYLDILSMLCSHSDTCADHFSTSISCRCMAETTSDSLQELGNLLVGFWAEAKEPCPNLPFTEENLRQFVMSSNGQHFLKLTLGELEKLLNAVITVIESH
ncbi:LOW QUALITY PROTEIN: uncharacterized protein Swt1 [Panulirus ornatus]|uniref:LOW QUALITY PROTEIN: uncharacterized protein Swt1 n=1 Tax=Panulirus ornatus TaxID=150431 RepID=UPI003A84AB56